MEVWNEAFGRIYQALPDADKKAAFAKTQPLWLGAGFVTGTAATAADLTLSGILVRDMFFGPIPTVGRDNANRNAVYKACLAAFYGLGKPVELGHIAYRKVTKRDPEILQRFVRAAYTPTDRIYDYYRSDTPSYIRNPEKTRKIIASGFTAAEGAALGAIAATAPANSLTKRAARAAGAVGEKIARKIK